MTVWLFTTLNADRIEEVLDIEAASFRRPWNRRAFESEFACPDAAQYAVLSADSRLVVAYVFVRIAFSEMHLLKIAVAPGQRHRGVATWLLERCFETVRHQGIESVYLEVRASNLAAIGLYDKLDLKIVGTRQGYYTDTGEDALVMVKKFDS